MLCRYDSLLSVIIVIPSRRHILSNVSCVDFFALMLVSYVCEKIIFVFFIYST